MSITSDELSRIFRVRRTLLQMLKDRGYIIPDTLTATTIDEFKTKYNNNSTVYDDMMLLVTHGDDQSKALVFFSNKKLTVEDFKVISSKLDQFTARRCLVITTLPASGLTLQFRQQLSSFIAENDCKIEHFEFKELLINITEHMLVPQHVPMKKDDVRELLSKYKLKLSQLPRIQESDPIAKYYGLSKGQVVKIIRQSETAGRYVTYRAVL